MGGRAPGTLAPGSSSGRRRGLARREPSLSRSFVVHSQRERILDAIANLSAAKGYAALTVEDIAQAAAISLNALYEHFEGKEDAFLVAYEVGHSKGLAIVERAYDAAPDWRSGVRAAIVALFDFLASEPAFAQMALVDALIATPNTAERSNRGVTLYAQMLIPGLDEAPEQSKPAAVTIEAITGGIFELCFSYALQGRIAELSELVPRTTYFALAPFIGGRKRGGLRWRGLQARGGAERSRPLVPLLLLCRAISLVSTHLTACPLLLWLPCAYLRRLEELLRPGFRLDKRFRLRGGRKLECAEHRRRLDDRRRVLPRS